jgi:hypothetical protein
MGDPWPLSVAFPESSDSRRAAHEAIRAKGSFHLASVSRLSTAVTASPQ